MSDARFRLLCAESSNFSEEGLRFVDGFTDLKAADLSEEQLIAQLPDVDGVMIRLQRKVSADMIQNSPRLKAIITPTTGLDHIALDAAADRQIEVFHLRGDADFLSDVHSTAEHTFALLLALVRRIPAAFADVRAGRWRQDIWRGRDLHGRAIGILGYGRLGSKVAGYARAFGMKVRGFDVISSRVPREEQVTSLDDLLEHIEVLSVHVPLEPETAGLIGERELRRLPPGAFVINTSRAEIVDERALLDCLRDGHLAGAAVDVLGGERSGTIDAHPMVAYARENTNLIVTPHIAGSSEEAIERTDLHVLEKFRRWLKQTGAYASGRSSQL